MTLEIDVLTLFPEMVSAPLAASIPGRIQERGIATVRTHDLRQWGSADIAASMTPPTVEAQGWSCDPSRSLPGSTRSGGRSPS